MNPYDPKPGMRDRLSRFASEFAGTFVLVASIKLIAGGTAGGTPGRGELDALAPLAIGLTLMVVIYLHGHNSLGMFNPSVTIAHFVRASLLHKMKPDFVELIMYFVAQILGGIGGGWFVALIFDDVRPQACAFHTYIQDGVDDNQAFAAELFFTVLLVTANMQCAANKNTAGNQFYGLAIGSVLFIGVVAIGPMTGCALNPAVWLGTAMSAEYCDTTVAGVDSVHWEHSWIYACAHVAAGVYAGLYFSFIHPDTIKNRPLVRQDTVNKQGSYTGTRRNSDAKF